MTHRQSCRHGHQFELLVEAAPHVACPVCGSLTKRKQTRESHAAVLSPAVPAESEMALTMIGLAPNEAAEEFEPASPVPAAAAAVTAMLHPDQPVLFDIPDLSASETSRANVALATPREESVNRLAEQPVAPAKPVVDDEGLAFTHHEEPSRQDDERSSSSAATAFTSQHRLMSDSQESRSGVSRSSVSHSGDLLNLRTGTSGDRTTTRMQTEIEVTEPPDLPGYKIVQELGRGGMGVVYLAHDEKLDRRVALKTLQRLSPVGLQRFKQEFRSLADVSHPNLAGLYDLLSDGRTWCFTMEILEAVDFLEFVWSQFDKLERDRTSVPTAAAPSPGPRLSPEALNRLFDGLKQLASGLHALHDAGMLHRDVKPSNIMVTSEGRVVLVDFGLASEIQRDGAPRGIQGTPHYMAPEQAACQPMSPASDWYAVGVMLYEVLTGHLPFEGKAVQVIRAKQVRTPRPPRELEPTVPPELNDLCVALLQLNPAQRPTVFDLLRTIGAGDTAELLRDRPRPHATQDLELVGRERHLQTLREAFARVVSGTTQSLFVHGKSGMGKSVLIQSFLEEIRSAQQAVVLTGRCYEQESVPFKALDSLVDSLADFLGKLPDEVARQAVPEDSLPLVRLFPVMGQLPGATDAGKPSIDNVDQQELRQRAKNALREMLLWLGARQPLVLYIDDLQWGDEDSALLLADLVRPPESPRVLLLGSYRSENIGTSLCLKTLATAYSTGHIQPHRQELAVEALNEQDATRLALMLLNRNDVDSLRYAGKIARESRGWPFFVWELVQHVQEAPEIADQSLELDEVIWIRVGRLPEETRQLLELIAVAGRPLFVAEAYRALNVGAKGQNLLVQLRTRNLIRITESEDESTVVEAYHDRIRESVIHHLDDRTTRRYNLDLAETVLHVSGISVESLSAYLLGAIPFDEPTEFYHLNRPQWRHVFDLSHFFAASGEHIRAMAFALIAAEQSRQQNSLEVAEQQYRTALLGCATSTPALRFRILEGLGDILMLRGKYDETEVVFNQARELAHGSEAATAPNILVTMSRIEAKLGELCFKRGELKMAKQHIEQALRTLHCPVAPKNLLLLIPMLLLEAVKQVLHTFFPSTFVGRKKLADSKTDLFIARLYDRLGYVYWFGSGMIPTLWAHLRELNLTELYPPTLELAQAYSLHAPVMSTIPNFDRGIRYAQKSLTMREEFGDLWGQGQSLEFYGVVLLAAGDYEASLEKSLQGARLLEQTGDFWELNMALCHVGYNYYRLGDMKAAVELTRQVYESGKQLGDIQAMAINLAVWALATEGDIPEELMRIEYERDRADVQTKVQTIMTKGLWLLFNATPGEAAAVFQEALTFAKKAGLKNNYVFPNHSLLANALRRQAIELREQSHDQYLKTLARAKSAARRAVKIGRTFPNDLPRSLRELGLISLLEGDHSQARKLLRESLEVTKRHKAPYEQALTELALGELALATDQPDANERMYRAETAINALRYKPSRVS